MKKVITIILLFSISFYSCNDLFDKLTLDSSTNRIVKIIKSEFSGQIISKYAPRDTKPTHIKIKTSMNKIIDISPNEKILLNVVVGDSIFKLKNENKVVIKKISGDTLSFFYILIPKSYRSHKNFPREWRNKWLESSKID